LITARNKNSLARPDPLRPFELIASSSQEVLRLFSKFSQELLGNTAKERTVCIFRIRAETVSDASILKVDPGLKSLGVQPTVLTLIVIRNKGNHVNPLDKK